MLQQLLQYSVEQQLLQHLPVELLEGLAGRGLLSANALQLRKEMLAVLLQKGQVPSPQAAAMLLCDVQDSGSSSETSSSEGIDGPGGTEGDLEAAPWQLATWLAEQLSPAPAVVAGGDAPHTRAVYMFLVRILEVSQDIFLQPQQSWQLYLLLRDSQQAGSGSHVAAEHLLSAGACSALIQGQVLGKEAGWAGRVLQLWGDYCSSRVAEVPAAAETEAAAAAQTEAAVAAQTEAAAAAAAAQTEAAAGAFRQLQFNSQKAVLSVLVAAGDHEQALLLVKQEPQQHLALLARLWQELVRGKAGPQGAAARVVGVMMEAVTEALQDLGRGKAGPESTAAKVSGVPMEALTGALQLAVQLDTAEAADAAELMLGVAGGREAREAVLSGGMEFKVLELLCKHGHVVAAASLLVGYAASAVGDSAAEAVKQFFSAAAKQPGEVQQEAMRELRKGGDLGRVALVAALEMLLAGPPPAAAAVALLWQLLGAVTLDAPGSSSSPVSALPFLDGHQKESSSSASAAVVRPAAAWAKLKACQLRSS